MKMNKNYCMMLLCLLSASLCVADVKAQNLQGMESQQRAIGLKAEINAPVLVNTCASPIFPVGIQVFDKNGNAYTGDILFSCPEALIVRQDDKGSFIAQDRVQALKVVGGLAFVSVFIDKYYAKELTIELVEPALVGSSRPLIAMKKVPLLYDKVIKLETIPSLTERKFRVHVESHDGEEVPDVLLWFKGPLNNDKEPKSLGRFISKDPQGQYTFTLPFDVQGGFVQVHSQHANSETVPLQVVEH